MATVDQAVNAPFVRTVIPTGHRVPVDQPPAASDLIIAFTRDSDIANTYFVSHETNGQFRVPISAGHMVPMDQPAAALELITSFTRNKPFAPQPSSAVVAAADGAPAGAGSKERGAGAAPQRIASSFRSREGRGVNGGSEKPQAS